MSTLITAVPLAASHPVGWGSGLWFVPLIFWVLLLATIVALALIRRRRGWAAGPPWAAEHGARSAEGVLAERFARGEIDEVEYRARLEVLRAQHPRS